MKEDKQLEFKLVRKEGQNNRALIPTYTDILKEIFPECIKAGELEVIFEKNLKNELYVVYNQATPIAITGLYWGDEEDICWFNWYGVLSNYRGKHFGEEILLRTFAIAKERFKGIRLYTDDSCEVAVTYLYPKYFDFDQRMDDVIIFSKSFTNNQLKKYTKPAYGLSENQIV